MPLSHPNVEIGDDDSDYTVVIIHLDVQYHCSPIQQPDHGCRNTAPEHSSTTVIACPDSVPMQFIGTR